jgi:anti-sigma B factor antagonist
VTEAIFEVETRATLDGTIVTVAGDVDLATSPDLQQALDTITEGDVHLDLGGVDFMDSTGLRVLLGASKAAAERGSTVHLHAVRDRVRSVIDMTRLTDRFEFD